MGHLHEALQKSPFVLHGQPFCFSLKCYRNTGWSVSFLCQQVFPAVTHRCCVLPSNWSTALTLSLAHALNQFLVVINMVVKIKWFLVVIYTVLVKMKQFFVDIHAAVKIKQFLVAINHRINNQQKLFHFSHRINNT